MLVGLCGPECGGKRTIADILERHHGFTRVSCPAKLVAPTNPFNSDTSDVNGSLEFDDAFQSVAEQCWRYDVNIVIDTILPGDKQVPRLLKRPYFFLIYVTAPLAVRFQRAVAHGRYHPEELPSFVSKEDELLYGRDRDDDTNIDRTDRMTSLRAMEQNCRLQLVNSCSNIDALREEIRKIDITNPERLRPGWDSYFMALACLASERTNCMKRRVGCVIVRNRRLVATGYNGTPSGVLNCIDGGCERCNGAKSKQGVALDLCFCLHAEENAIIEAGRERCEGATLYTSLFPCLLCAKVRA
jgi:dCMP deaminase